jgi:hypothetical protein
MSVDIRSHPLLEAWADPRSGVVSYILKTDVAACRQSFYFTNPGMTNDGSYGEGRYRIAPSGPLRRHVWEKPRAPSPAVLREGSTHLLHDNGLGRH